MEEKKANAMEMAAQANEKREKIKEAAQVRVKLFNSIILCKKLLLLLIRNNYEKI